MPPNTNPVIWNPSGDDLTKSPLARFRDLVNSKYKTTLKTYHDVHSWSVNPATSGDFWMEIFDFLDMRATKAPSRAFRDEDKRNMFPSPEFFPGARMNFAGSILENRNRSEVAILEVQEGSLEPHAVTWGELYIQVDTLAGAMKAHGVQRGDRVAAVISTSALAVALCLATLSIGAIWSSMSPDFGPKAILDRILQIDPKLVFASSSVTYNGKIHDLRQNIEGWAEQVSRGYSLSRIVLTSRSKRLKSKFSKIIYLDTFSSAAQGRALEFEQLPFSHPAFIFYSSGTTGAPKCILHSAGGVMLQIKKDYVLQIGVLPGDILFQYTTTAWIMWAFLLTALSTGAKIVVLDGSPLHPSLAYIPRLLEKLRVTVFGTSAKYLTDLMDNNTQPREHFDLTALRKVTSTGSVLPSDVARWFYNAGFPKQVQLISGSGGTDCACSFVTGNPLTSVRADEISGKSLGMAVDVFDPLSPIGRPCKENEPGELVCKEPFPSQPLTFWGPNGKEKFKAAYFSVFPGIWVQGDLIRVNPMTGGIQMLGRSDGVLNPSGVRFGSAEIYNVIRLFPDVEDSICTSQRRPHDRDEAVMLFLKLKPDRRRTSKLKEEIKNKIGENLSKRHIPRYIFYVDDIPYSKVGKKLEITVKNIISGRNIESSVVANPESLSIYEKYFHVEEVVRYGNDIEIARL